MKNRCSTCQTVIGYRVYNRFFLHRLRTIFSYSEAGMNVPTFSRLGILLRLRRPHELATRPPGRPAPGEIEADGHGGSGKTNETVHLMSTKGPRSVESSWNPSPATRRFRVSYIHIHIHTYLVPGMSFPKKINHLVHTNSGHYLLNFHLPVYIRCFK